MSFQPNTLQGVATTGYSIVANTAFPPVNFAQFICRSGEFWVRPSPASAASTVPPSGVLAGYTAATGANTNVTTPVTAPLTKGWLRVLAGDMISFGDTINDPITQLDVWCVVAGDLLVQLH